MKKKILDNIFIYYIFIFIFLFVFFAYIHPVITFDTDDWLYNGTYRPPVPTLGIWNPTKIFPEYLQPATALFAAYILFPIINDYYLSLTIANAFIIAFFITAYFHSIHLLLSYKKRVSNKCCFFIVLFFICIHFLVLLTQKQNNDYLFYSRDITCYYHYTISNLFCALLVLWLMRNDINTINNNFKWGILFLYTYLVICSNLYSSVLLIAYAGAILTKDLITDNNNLTNYIKKHYYYLFIILFWLFIQLIEVNGERANSYGYLQASFYESLKETIIRFIGIQYNRRFLQICFIIIIASLLNIFISKKDIKYYINEYSTIIIAFVFTLSYLILLSTKVKPEYIQKGDVIFPLIFYFLLIIILFFADLCKKIRLIRIFLPFIAFIAFFEIQSVDKIFKDVQYWNGTTLLEAKNFNSYILKMIQEADVKGVKEITIKVPWYNDYINWPLDYQHSEYMGKTLYKHNQISYPIKVYFEVIKDNYSE